jgi:hypothetical protein
MEVMEFGGGERESHPLSREIINKRHYRLSLEIYVCYLLLLSESARLLDVCYGFSLIVEVMTSCPSLQTCPLVWES